jgi:hypothetical protein
MRERGEAQVEVRQPVDQRSQALGTLCAVIVASASAAAAAAAAIWALVRMLILLRLLQRVSARQVDLALE